MCSAKLERWPAECGPGDGDDILRLGGGERGPEFELEVDWRGAGVECDLSCFVAGVPSPGVSTTLSTTLSVVLSAIWSTTLAIVRRE